MLKNVSPKSEDNEIEEFLYGLRIEKILHILDSNQEKTGCVLVKMLTDEDTEEALCYNKRKLRHKVIESNFYLVEEISEDIFLNALQNNNIDDLDINYSKPNATKSMPFLTSEQKSRAVKLRGFSQKFTKKEVLGYLRDFEITKHNLILQQNTLDKSTGEAIAVLKSQEERERALQTLSNKMFNGRLIEAFPYLNT